MQIITANTPEQFEWAKKLFMAYQQYLGVDLCFQDFDAELQQLDSMYAPPGGALLLAKENDTFVGCVAVRGKGSTVCEMKRLYVTDDCKGRGIGRLLAKAIIEKAKELGYKKMILDTLERLVPALQLYKTLGFIHTEAYYANPLSGVIYLQKEL